MSIRIHQLSKKIGIENKELLALLQDRGFNVTSASSTIDNISADSLVEEFAKKAEAEAAKAEENGRGSSAEAAASDGATENEKETMGPSPVQDEKPAAKPAAPPPPAAFVKSAEQVAREKEQALAANRAQPVPPPPPPAAASPRPVAPPPPRPQGPQPVAPPRTSGAPSSPAPVSRPPSTPPPVSRPSSAGPVPPPPIPRPAPATPPPAGSDSSAEQGGSEAAEGDSDEIRTIQVKPPIVVRDFATALGLKPFKLISELMEMGIFASMNQSIEENVASQLAERHGVLLDIRHRGDAQATTQKPKEKKEEQKVDESKLMEPRPPVVCILGHVDHGKTTLLDRIRSAHVAEGEFGGITQHIGAYQIEVEGRKITFLDTPGHAAFNKMRARGANVTDIAILVVAADDGFMPQTDEALKYIRNAGVTPIVAINKIDAKGANIDRVKTQMQERGIAPEDWGGEVITVSVSALKGEGIPDLLEMILLQSDLLELRANPKKPGSGVVIEAQMEIGRGPTTTVIVQSGTVKVGDALVCGPYYNKIKALFDDQGRQIKQATPATPIRVIGWSGTPDCGATFETVKNERAAKKLAEENEIQVKKQDATAAPAPVATTVENLFEAMAATKKKVLRLVIKSDVFGSGEAVVSSLEDINSDKVSMEIVSSEVGMISKNDVLIASAAKAEIIGFNVRLENGVDALAKHHGVKVSQYKIIYELVDAVRDQMADLLEPEVRETKLGAAEVRQVFPISRGYVAGCLVVEGRVSLQTNARVRRGGQIEFDGKIDMLRRLKDEVKEVRAGTECGIMMEGFNDYQPGDVIECYEVHKFRASL